MDLIQKMALSKFNLTPAEKDAIPAGTHGFDFVVRVQGSLAKGEDTEKPSTCSIPVLATLALLTAHMGVTREQAIKKICAAVSEAIELDKQATEALLKEIGVVDALKRIQTDVVAKLPKTPVKGGVYGKPIAALVGIVEEMVPTSDSNRHGVATTRF